MRRIAVLLAAPVLAIGVLAGCGSSSGASGSAHTVTVSGKFGATPKVTIPASKAGSKLDYRAVIKGSGPAFQKTDSFMGNYALYVWSGTKHQLKQSTFTKQPTLIAGQLLPGLEKALVGQKMGSRVLAVIPPAQGFGKSGNQQAGIKGTDTLVFVVDMIKDFPATASASGKQVSSGGGGLPTVTVSAGKAPTIKVPSGKAPSKLVIKTLAKGTGTAISKNQTVVVQYVGAIWRTGKVFDSSWQRGQPFSFQIGASPSQVIAGWDKGLLGEQVGSRVMLVVPPADGYGKSGNQQAGIKGTDTLVFVVDILGTFGINVPH